MKLTITTPFNTATPNSAMKPTLALIEKFMPRMYFAELIASLSCSQTAAHNAGVGRTQLYWR